MKTVAVILNWNQAVLTSAAASAIKPQVDHVVVVDNLSELSDRSRLERYVREGGMEFLQTGSNLGYAGGCNRGIRAALKHDPDALLVMNNDVFVEPGGVDVLVAGLTDTPNLAAVGPVVYEYERPDVVLHVNCSYRSRWARSEWVGRGRRRDEISESPVFTDYLSGEVLLMRTSVLQSIGGFDERFISYFEDVEWSLRARRAGWRLQVLPGASARHMVGASGGSERGEYLRARNRGLIILISEGSGRARVLLRTLPQCILVFAASARRGAWRRATRGTLRGWWDGLARRY